MFLCNHFVNLWTKFKELACYENPDDPSCIDLIIKNNLLSFQNCVMETSLSDFHKNNPI